MQSRTQIPPDQQRLIFGGKELENEKRLSYYKISNEATLFLVMRLYGGTEQVKRPQAPTRREIDQSIPRSDELCMILLYTEDDRVRMPCRHVISPDGLMEYCWNEVCVGVKTKVVCCLCNDEWDVDTIRRYGGATDEEIAVLQECLSRNYCLSDPKISECPGCTSFCQRINESKKCTLCSYCSNKGKRYHFCWDCKKEWKGSPSNEYCGNDKCTNEEILQKLRTCPETGIEYLPNLKVPSIRACPNCGSLVEHAGRCKHVTCGECNVKFCFVCLRACSEDGSSYCGSHRQECSVAERQTTIPRRR